MKASQIQEFFRWYFASQESNPEQILRQMSDEQFRLVVWTTAEVFSTLKKEAQRRGIWDELKGTKVGK